MTIYPNDPTTTTVLRDAGHPITHALAHTGSSMVPVFAFGLAFLIFGLCLLAIIAVSASRRP